jgi:large subunit ribosomal protein L15
MGREAKNRKAQAEAAPEKMGLHNLVAAPGSHRDRKRLGRGPGSGTGKTSGKGHKGIKARSGHHGPITRRLPKRGFTNPFREASQVVRLDDLARLDTAGVGEITRDALVEAGLVSSRKGHVKVLANGEISQAVTVRGLKVSAGARVKIVAAGGRVEE